MFHVEHEPGRREGPHPRTSAPSSTRRMAVRRSRADPAEVVRRDAVGTDGAFFWEAGGNEPVTALR
ncbi:hypothetical protein ABZ470_29655 [Streptosporangium sp. NPDC020072]|uniref:hypothetical protein n=1 Tax=Streptosporangium sp. NPDC020072 TaxID=3154788 RepID=UPI00342B5021